MRYGDYTDGGYVLCKNFLNNSEGLINLGVEGRDLFGCGISSEFRIPNYQYDCTNQIAPQCPTGFNSFHAICLGERAQRSNNLQFYSLKNMVDASNLTRKHITMKIDVQGAEWYGLRSFPLEYLDYVDQIIFEIHLMYFSIPYTQVWGNLQMM